MNDPRLAKFKRRAAQIGTAEHLAKILKTFPGKHLEVIQKDILPLVKPDVREAFQRLKKAKKAK